MRATIRLVLATAALSACAASGDEAASAPPGPTEGGGTAVSFGGAQDMGQFRGALERGDIPTPDMLDANGFFNEHYNAAPEVACEGMLCLTPGLSVGRDWLTGKHQATLQVAVYTPVDPAAFERLPMNLVVIVDHSGSMASDDRLEKVKGGLHTMVGELRDEDRIALISFDDVVTHDVPFAQTLDRDRLHAAIDRLAPRGGTNIYSALEVGFSLLGEYPTNERQNRVIFLSDGVATVGNTNRQSILDMAKTRITSGIGLTTIGVGDSFDVELMRGLAENGAGNYYFLEDGAAADEVFTEELDTFMTPIALDIQLSAAASRGWTLGHAIGSNLWQGSKTGGTMSIPAVFLASRESQEPTEGRRGGGSMIFIPLTAVEGAGPDIANLTLSYRIPGRTTRTTHTLRLDYRAGSDPRETPAEVYLSGNEMAERFAMYNLFLGLRNATYSSSSCAMAALESTRRNAVAWNERHPDPDITADLVLVDRYVANLRASGAAVTELASCPEPMYPEEFPGWDYYEGEGHGHYHGCASASRGSCGWLVMLGAAGYVVRRRRRR